jgi:hypothetical protein
MLALNRLEVLEFILPSKAITRVSNEVVDVGI